MIVGVPKEIKSDEYRVAMIPVGVEELTRAGHKVLIQSRGRGRERHHRRDRTPPTAPRSSAPSREVWQRADLIVKVKEPLPDEWPLHAARADGLHLLPLRRRRGADAGGHRSPASPPSPTRRSATRRARCRC